MRYCSLAIALLTASFANLHAEDCCMPEYTPGEPLCVGCAGYSQYAGVELECGWNVTAFGEFLYWRPYQSNTWSVEEIPANTFVQPQFALTQKFGYRSGFRVGLGMVAHCFDDWMFNVDYLRYHHSFSKTFSATAPNNLSSNELIFGGLLASSIRNELHFHYDVVSVNIRRPNYLGQRVILSPFLGLKWLKRNLGFSQDLIDRASGGLNRGLTTFKYTSIGIAAGFDGSWLLCWGLSFIGNADVALLYPYQRSMVQVVTPAVVSPANPIITTVNHFRHLDLYAKGGMGIAWGSYFCCNRYHVYVSTTFDFMGDIVKMDASSGMYQNGSAILMGLSVRGQFDF